MLKKDFLISKDESFHLSVMLSEHNDEKLESFIVETYSGAAQIPSEVNEHFEQYGFEELVNSVSKQVNHENIIVKEYSFDRLMIGRYIDFLMKAETYLSWFKADQATAKEKIKRIKKQQNKKS